MQKGESDDMTTKLKKINKELVKKTGIPSLCFEDPKKCVDIVKIAKSAKELIALHSVKEPTTREILDFLDELKDNFLLGKNDLETQKRIAVMQKIQARQPSFGITLDDEQEDRKIRVSER